MQRCCAPERGNARGLQPRPGRHRASEDQPAHRDQLERRLPFGELRYRHGYLELRQEWKSKRPNEKEKPHITRALHADARFDIYHFEEITDLPDEEDEGPLDPGTLLLVLNKLARLCQGEALDPQTGELLE